MTAVPTPLWRRIFAPVGHPSALRDAHGFLQERVTLYTKTLFWFLLVFSGIGIVKLAAFGLSDPDLLRFNLLSLMVFVGLTVALGIDWWYLARSRRPLSLLHAYESAGTVLVCGAIGSLVFTLPPGLPELAVSFGPTLVLVIRAALVPSTALRTTVVGAASTVLFSALVWLAVRDIPPSEDMIRAFSWMAAASTGFVFTAATAVVSRVIYGLQQTVREAMQLGQYALEEKLGEGGMGCVYLARHALLRRPTAVKVLHPNQAGEQAVQRFEREVRETSRLTHPNTVDIFDYGHTPEGVFYYAMEYLDGLDLEELIKRFGPLPPGRVIHLVSQLAHALGEAHAVGLIHRDVKPANVMVCDRGGIADMVKVLDFGLVKDLDAPASAVLSAANTLTGTPHYMAPEAILSPDGVDARTDLYGVGCTAYYLLTGRTVFDGKNLVEVCSHHLHTAPTPPSERGVEVPADLEAIVLRTLAKKPEDRFASARELWRALRACGDVHGWDLERASAWWREHGPEIRATRHARRIRVSTDSDTLAVALDRRSPH